MYRAICDCLCPAEVSHEKVKTMTDKLFDPDDVSVSNGCYYALPYTCDQSDLLLLSVPWDVTASYGGGASSGPDAMIEASEQIDLYDYHFGDIYRRGIATLPIDETILEESRVYRNDARKVMAHLSEGGAVKGETARRIARINAASAALNEKIYRMTFEYMSEGKIVGLVGGDHSTPLGYMRAVGERHGPFGILHIDAHADLREAYEGFTYSHASIMYNALREVGGLERLTQVAVRDYCRAEADLMERDERVVTFFDADMAAQRMCGTTWQDICRRIVSTLPQKVYVSFDIDGLSPDNCPSTGTPVPGGLSFNEAVFLIDSLVSSGRTIVGFDLCEVAPDGSNGDNMWDANVGARMLYKLCGFTLKSNPKRE